MDINNTASLDDLTMKKDNVNMYAVKDMHTEVYEEEDFLFPRRHNQNKDLQEMQELHALAEMENNLKNDMQKAEEHGATEHLTLLADKMFELEQSKKSLTNSCMQLFIQYVTLVPDNLVTGWRYEKAYLLVFLKGKPDYFNADSDKVTFSDLCQVDKTFTVRGKINDFYKKVYMEFVVVWQKK